MLVSHNHKFIFIKTIKTAGTSTEIFLEPYCISSLVESHSRKMISTEEGIVGTRMSQFKAEKDEYYNHMTPSKIKEKLGSDIFENYTKIANVRNPFDILVSHYHFKPTYELFTKNKNYTFEDYLFRTDVVEKLAENYRNLHFIEDKFVIDEILRHENLQNDIDNLIKKLNLPIPTRNLSNYKESSSRKYKAYSDFYTNQTKDLVEKHFKFYLDLFNYTF
jgi:hypothetical protein